MGLQGHCCCNARKAHSRSDNKAAMDQAPKFRKPKAHRSTMLSARHRNNELASAELCSEICEPSHQVFVEHLALFECLADDGCYRRERLSLLWASEEPFPSSAEHALRCSQMWGQYCCNEKQWTDECAGVLGDSQATALDTEANEPSLAKGPWTCW
eukprot:TRINITY_DN105387_c0_g1_i1.p1 TRINITY_DN105387_c0_g1~~TRINITY_DN105387_c0_g1_i1.p1  ORF type:complete len:181 (-),score=26.60 TRINITY_DN105387_c0_g1_i1:151-618(-)